MGHVGLTREPIRRSHARASFDMRAPLRIQSAELPRHIGLVTAKIADIHRIGHVADALAKVDDAPIRLQHHFRGGGINSNCISARTHKHRFEIATRLQDGAFFTRLQHAAS